MKRVFGVVIFFVCAMLLSSCGIPKPPDEAQIMEDIPDQYVASELTIHYNFLHQESFDFYPNEWNVSIDKRQTDEKEDLVYCQLDAEDSLYHVTKFFKLLYIYYDEGGWVLEDLREYEDPIVSFLDKPFDEDFFAQECSELESRTSHSSGLGGTVNFTVTIPDEAVLDNNTNTVTYRVHIDEDYPNYTQVSEREAVCRFAGYDMWVDYHDKQILSSDWSKVIGEWVLYTRSGEPTDELILKIEEIDFENATASGTCEFSFTGYWGGDSRHSCSLENANIYPIDGGTMSGAQYEWEISLSDKNTGEFAGVIYFGKRDARAVYIGDTPYGKYWEGDIVKKP